jgi:hypothetical protein
MVEPKDVKTKHQAEQAAFSKPCICCRREFSPDGNFNIQRQLTCEDPQCQRALKTMRQVGRRIAARRKQRKGAK